MWVPATEMALEQGTNVAKDGQFMGVETCLVKRSLLIVVVIVFVISTVFVVVVGTLPVMVTVVGASVE